ncbi:hypothetical protein HYALB_00001859 [Hymenoscyphus albidus]|uniref:Glycosyltransferase 2 n=1 Tax=Hymenoscyphus albidus TaxID=595503 RepID=A0A9N9LPB5_9HELO|nr:hypothetical protein HYALB_00001859 [Hymenoscyphus albidus]
MVPRFFPGDEELGKKDDEYKPGMKSPLGLRIIWQQRRTPSHLRYRRTFKRLGLGLLALVALYYFFYNMPTDLGQPRPRPHYHPVEDTTYLPTSVPDVTLPKEPGKKPPSLPNGSKNGPGKEVWHDFSGPIKFYKLASTLKSVSGTRGSQLLNRNVLFAAASLKSAATLLPIACEMALQERNFVHFVLMGRDDIEMDILKSVNGVTKSCKITFHDARPDFSLESSDHRMEVSVSAAFNHINTYIHPQATFLDKSGEEEPFMFKGLKPRAVSNGRTVIELPAHTEQNLMWLTMLDSASLSAWNKITIDIVVHAQPAASGSLMRLLDSLKKADYMHSSYPRLTIELPYKIDEPTQKYLETFRWPIATEDDPGNSNLLTLHHRIPQHDLTPEENSIRFLESFWPAEPTTSHVLVLAPQTELSPYFFHYLKYAMLEYKYSKSKSTSSRDNFMGIVLELPSTHLNDSTTFTPPTVEKTTTPFIWQSPSSNAALYFGDKWTELHDFVARSLNSQHKLAPSIPIPKTVSKNYPSWLEYFSTLMRARGYWMLYPGLEDGESFVTIHNELYHSPEEYASDPVEEKTPASLDPKEELTADAAQHPIGKEKPLLTTPLQTILTSKGDLPLLTAMPLLGYDGQLLELSNVGEQASTYSDDFRVSVGGCAADADEKERVAHSAEDLFCSGDEEVKNA